VRPIKPAESHLLRGVLLVIAGDVPPSREATAGGKLLPTKYELPTKTGAVAGLVQHVHPTAEQIGKRAIVLLAVLCLLVDLPPLRANERQATSVLRSNASLPRRQGDVAANTGVGPVRGTPAGGTPESIDTPSPRPIIVGLPQLREGPGGNVLVEPNVKISAERPQDAAPRTSPSPGVESNSNTPWWTSVLQRLPGPLGSLPLYEHPIDELPEVTPEWIGPPLESQLMEFPLESSSEPIFGRLLDRLHGDDCDCCREQGGPLARRLPTYGMVDEGGGIGRERLPFSQFELDVTQPQNQFRFRIDLASGFRTPDRAEYFFAGPTRGPIPETSVDYQDLRFLMEVGGPAFSVGTEIPIRILDPVRNPNTAGLSDLNLTTKTVLLTGKDWQLTQIFRTYMNTGAPGKGLGTGHISIEPGMLARYRASDSLFWHGAIQYWVPLGGDPMHSGEILKYGVGLSHLLYDSDTFAIIDSFEVVGWTVLDGQRVDPFTGLNLPVDGEGVIHCYPGIRFVRDTGGDFGLVEFGVSGTIGFGNSRWMDDLVRLEFRVLY
jgi:hypothetical protein